MKMNTFFMIFAFAFSYFANEIKHDGVNKEQILRV